MSFTELITTAVARGERYEYDYVVAPGSVLSVLNVNKSYGDMQHWGTFMSMGYDLLGGSINVYRSLNLYAKCHTMTFTSEGLAVDLQPAVYCPKNYRLEFLTFKLYIWTP